MKTEAPFADATPSILKKMMGGKTKNALFKQFQIERARTLESFQKGSTAHRNFRSLSLPPNDAFHREDVSARTASG